MAATGPSSPQSTKETPSFPDAKAAAPPQCEEPAAAASASAKSDSTATAPMPTYQETKQSKAYKLAKGLLQDGALDDALSTLELTLQCTLQSLAKGESGEDDDENGGVELHESLAPLYYLYGTTLLYSVEESDVMMAKNGGGDQEVDASAVADEGGNNEEEQGENDAEQGEEAPANAADTDGDLQIAWENLDIARAIVTRMITEEEIQSFLEAHSVSDQKVSSATVALKSDATTTKEDGSFSKKQYTPEEFKELVLDLAQIHIRLGDLLRANGRDLDAIPDYKRALELRACLGKFDRSVADSHFGLASTYAESVNLNDDGNSQQEEGKKGLTEEEVGEFREKSLDHYLACGVAFAGLIAELCGEDPEKVTAVEDGEEGVSSSTAAAAAPAHEKSCNIHSEILAKLRERVSTLEPLKESDKDKVSDLKETLDEIQEAMDANEDTEQALKDVAVMKANEIKKHAAKAGADGDEDVVKIGEGGVTTTIGFGAPTMIAATGTASAPTASAAPASAAAPMMVIKKKKKKPQQPVPEADAKRAKTE